jgi:hypothetical protein
MAEFDPVFVAELERIAPRDPAPKARWDELRPRRLSLPLAAVVAALVAVLALAIPWHRGPAALSPADAARIVQRATAALATHGRVLHLRLHISVASRAHPQAVAWSGDTEEWIDEAGAQNYRMRTTFPNLPSPLETGGVDRGTSPRYVYDAATRTLYYVPIYRMGPGTGFVDPITQARRDLSGSTGLTIHREGETYRIEDDHAPRGTTTLIVDAKTYRPIKEISTIGAGAPFALFSQKPRASLSALWQTTTEYRTYEYLDNAKLASIRAQLPHAAIGVAPDMPTSFRRLFEPWTG